MSRVGNEIDRFSISPNYYAVTLADNSVKVVRVDNNKAVLTVGLLNLKEEPQLSSVGKKLISVCGTKI